MIRRLACLFPVFASLSAAAVEFTDPLSNPLPHRWTMSGGEWSAENGILTARPSSTATAVLRGLEADDFELDVEVRPEASGTEVGVVFRARDNSSEGYYVGVTAGTNAVTWAATDPTWRIIARRPVPVGVDEWQHLRIQASGGHIRIFVENEGITARSWPVFDGFDTAFAKGTVALHALNGAASFRNLKISPYRPDPSLRTYTNPVQPGCADPVVLHHRGKYYAYTTHTAPTRGKTQGIRLHTSKNLVEWKDEGFVLKDQDSWGDHGFWAPDIVERNGMFYLYYASEERMCVATAKSPNGPFRQEDHAPMEPAEIRIDGHVFEDDDGQRYFYYVSFGEGNEIWGGKLNDDMVTVDPSTLRRMMKPDQEWELHQGAVTEGPEMLKHKGTYYLTYSGSHFKAPEYAVGYATSNSPLGPWKKHEFNPVMKSTAYARGTAHHCFTPSPDGRETFIVYHRHHSSTRTNPRHLAIDRVRFVPDPDGGPDVIQIHGPTSSPQPFPSGAR